MKEELTEEEKRAKREKMRKYQHVYYLKHKFMKDCNKKKKEETPKTIQIIRGDFTVSFSQ
jgi:hypothetical protein